MAAVEPLTAGRGRARTPRLSAPAIQALTLAGLLVLWEAVGRSGLFYRGVFPSVSAILRALATLLLSPAFYETHLATTAMEVAVAFVLGGGAGVVVGLALGAWRFGGRAFEPLVYYAAPTPKIVFLPVFLVLFGVGPGSKIALGALSCFFPMTLSVASGVRQVSPAWLRVGRSLRMTWGQTVLKIFLPALRGPIASGARISFGLATIGSLLAELKLSNAGLGFLALDYYRQFDIASMFATLVVVFGLSALCNGVIGHFAREPGASSR